jgi:late competence protein required for DNA uptake (superfamily II DNA/RNA helicase)
MCYTTLTSSLLNLPIATFHFFIAYLWHSHSLFFSAYMFRVQLVSSHCVNHLYLTKRFWRACLMFWQNKWCKQWNNILRGNMETNSKNVIWLLKKLKFGYIAYIYVFTCKSWDTNLLLKNLYENNKFQVHVQ